MNIKRIWTWSIIFGVLIASIVYFSFYSNLPVTTASVGGEEIEAAEEEEVEPEDQKREMGNPMLEVSKEKRAVSIKINLEEGVSGYIEPESKVDIMAFEIDEDAEKVSQTAVLVLENVKVLASGKSPDSPDEALRYETVTVEVTPEEGLVLGLTAKYKDGFYLMLRNDEDTGTGKKGLKETKEILKEVVVEEEDGGDEE